MTSLDTGVARKVPELQTFNEKRSQLSNQFSLLQKEIWNVFRLRSDVTESKNLCMQLHSFNNAIAKSYSREGGHFTTNINKLKNRISLLHHRAKNLQPTGESVSRIKALMLEIETCVETLRSSQRNDFDELQQEEQRLWQEILSHERRFEVWEKKKFNLQVQSNLDHKLVRVTADRDDAEGDRTHVDIKRFKEFLSQHGGHTGGWDEVDHSTFLKHRMKQKNSPDIGEALLPFIPVHSSEAIQQHEQWYITYCDLSDRNKEAIKLWRESQAKLKAEHKSAVTEVNVAQNKRNAERREKREQQRAEERRDKLTRLTEWRLGKEREAARSRAEERDLEEKRKDEEENERAWKDVVRLQVAEYISCRKEAEGQAEQLRLVELAEERDSGRLANREVTKFLARDRRIAETQKEKADALVQQELERKKQLEILRQKVRVVGTRDAERATGKTEGWKSREKANKESRSSVCPSRDGSVAAPVMKLGTQRLATPSWRQNL